ncbi:MAG: acyl--CoA ligase [Oscillospiraceae bacterium]|nr:acyl--CoA ligase [Oscillospiraceae bacterium]
MESMVEVLSTYANKQPDRLFAVDQSGNEFTYHEAWLRVRQAAVFFSENKKISQEDKILVECKQDCWYLLIDLACELAGAVFVPIEENASEDRIRAIWDETEAVLFIACSGKCPDLTSVSFEEAFSVYGSDRQLHLPRKEAIAEILYTTGTTGKSKGIVITNEANVALAENILFGVEMKPQNTELIPIPISHSHGIRCCYANLLNGGTIVLTDGLMNLKNVFRMIEQYSVTAMDVSPSAVQLLIKVAKGAFWKYGKQMDYIQIGTAAMPEQLKEQLVQELPGVRLYNFYGSTESGRSCVLDFSKENGRKNCIGKPTRNADIICTDENREKIHATFSNPGLIASRGKMNMSCYWKNPELTSKFMRDNFVFTNDLGYIDEEGYVYVLGRKDDVINYNGIKIAPEEIEEVAVDYPEVTDAACVPYPDRVAGQIPVLYISVRNESLFDKMDYMQFLRSRVDGNKFPKRVSIIEKIPRTANGKIRRKDLMQ